MVFAGAMATGWPDLWEDFFCVSPPRLLAVGERVLPTPILEDLGDFEFDNAESAFEDEEPDFTDDPEDLLL